jgi:putative phosphoribosyl transferase
MRFRDRRDAGRQLAAAVQSLAAEGPIIAALPRGGVPVAVEVARALQAPLTLILVRKLGVPGHAEFAFGAIGEDGTCVVDEDVIEHLGLIPQDIEGVQRREETELRRRARVYGVDHAMDFTDRTVVIVDDGMATGSTMAAAVQVARHRGARRVVVALPVAARQAVESLREQADAVHVLDMPLDFRAVGEHYLDFTQVTDAQVRAALAS